MEINGICTALNYIRRLRKWDDLPASVRADLVKCETALNQQVDYLAAVEYQFEQLIRHYSGKRYRADLVPCYGYPATLDREYIDEVLRGRVAAIRAGGKQCLMCGNVIAANSVTCPHCHIDTARAEAVYDEKVNSTLCGGAP